MPIYEYCCLKCNEIFSVLQSVHAEKNETKCPKCGASELKKMMSSFCCSTAAGHDAASSAPSGHFGGG